VVKKKPPLSLFVFIDALGWEILKNHPDFLKDEMDIRKPLNTIFGYSSTCDPTIITGLMPRDHGHFSFFYYNPEASPFGVLRPLGLLPRSITRRGRVRRILSRMIKRYYGYTGYFQIYNMPFNRLHLFDYSEKNDLYEPGGINNGQRTIFDHLRDNHIPFAMSDWRRDEEFNLGAMEETFRKGEVRFAYLYLAAMDAVLHARGSRAQEVSDKMAWYDTRLRHLFDVAKRSYSDVRIHVFSDHGMTDTVAEFDLIRRIEALDLAFGADYAAVYDSTMARFWFLRAGTREAVTRVLETTEAASAGRILDEATLREWGVDFPGRTYGELFFLMNPGVLLNPSYMGETRLEGMHGFEPHHKDSVAAIMSNSSPGKGAELPEGLEDMYSLMRRECDRVSEDLQPGLAGVSVQFPEVAYDSRIG